MSRDPNYACRSHSASALKPPLNATVHTPCTLLPKQLPSPPPSPSLCDRFHDRSWPTAPCSRQPARFTLLIHYSDTARMIFLILTLRCPVSTFPRPAHQRGEVCLSWHLTFDHPGSTRHFSSLAGTPSIMCFPEPAFSQLFPMFRLLCFNNCLLNL